MKKAALSCLVMLALAAPIVDAADPDPPQIHADRTVTFHAKAPDAHQVVLNGDWPGGGREESRTPMVKDAQGVWSVTVGPLEPDLWTYSYTVDGVKVADDWNPHFAFDRWGGSYASLLLIPGKQSYNYEMHDVPHGTVAAVWYPAPSLKIAARRALIYTPPGYETNHTRYPVLYLASNEETGWILLGRAANILDNLIAAGRAKPMIVVMMSTQPDTAASSDATDEPLPSTLGRPSRFLTEKNANGGRLSGPSMLSGGESIPKDLVPFVDQRFRTVPDRDHRAIVGMSAAGAAAFYGGVTHPRVFGWIGSFSGGWPAFPGIWVSIATPPDAAQFFEGPDIHQSVDPDKLVALLPTLNTQANFRLLYFSIGLHDPLMTTHVIMKKLLAERGLKYVDVEVPGYHHDWRFFRWCLVDFATRLF